MTIKLTINFMHEEHEEFPSQTGPRITLTSITDLLEDLRNRGFHPIGYNMRYIPKPIYPKDDNINEQINALPEMNDITIQDLDVEVGIRYDGRVLWVNVGPKCVLRICQISKLTIEDKRRKEPPMTSSTTTTTTYHAVMIDETGCEFPTSVEARTREEALHILEEMYPESRCDQLETEEDTARREKAIYDHINAGGDWDDEGRPIFHYHYPQDNNDEEN